MQSLLTLAVQQSTEGLRVCWVLVSNSNYKPGPFAKASQFILLLEEENSTSYLVPLHISHPFLHQLKCVWLLQWHEENKDTFFFNLQSKK